MNKIIQHYSMSLPLVAVQMNGLNFKYFFFAMILVTACSEPEDHTRSDVSLSDATQSDTNPDADGDTTSNADTTPNLDCNPDTSTDPCYCDRRIYSEIYSCCPSLGTQVDIYYVCADDSVEDNYGRWAFDSNEGPLCPSPNLPPCPWLVDN